MKVSNPSSITRGERPGAGDCQRLGLGAGRLDDEPGWVWQSRQTLSQESIDRMNTLPVLCVENGQVKVYEQAIDSFTNDVDAMGIIRKFIETMKQKKFEVTIGQEYRDTEDEAKTVGAIRIKESDKHYVAQKETFEPSKKRKHDEEHKEENPTREPSDCVTLSSGTLENPVSKVARQLEMFKVPAAFAAGDKMTLFDLNSMKKVNQHIEVPTDAYDGMKLDIEALPLNIKVLCCDHRGFKCGKKNTFQHANRLHIHRQVCSDPKCPVLGCGNESVWALFKSLVDVDVASKYKFHWSARKRENQRKHGHQLRINASA